MRDEEEKCWMMMSGNEWILRRGEEANKKQTSVPVCSRVRYKYRVRKVLYVCVCVFCFESL